MPSGLSFHSLSLILLCLTFWSGTGPSKAAEHRIEESAVLLNLPDNWSKDTNQDWGYLINPPERALGVRVHLKSPANKTLWDILNETLKNFETKVTDQSAGRPGHRVVAVDPFKAHSGIEGLRITTGSFDKNKKIRPNVFHYIFFNTAGKSVCVCVYCSAGIPDAATSDALILPSLKPITKQTRHQ